MESIIKKYFWTINLVFLALAAWMVAGSINVVIAHKLRPVPTTTQGPAQKKQAGRTTQEVKDNQVIIKLNLFGSAMALPVETVEQGPDMDESKAEELVDGAMSSLRASLVGTVVASEKEWSMAMLTDMNKSETGMYRIHDAFMGDAIIVEVLPQRVYMLRNGVREYLDIQDKSAPKNPNAKHEIAAAPAEDASLGAGIKKVNDSSYIIQRSEIDKTLANLNSIAMQARIVPSFVNGEANGFKLFAIRPGSLYSQIGIENGDIIQKINGFQMNSPDKALEIYQKLKSASSVEVEVIRRGQPQKLTYQIQ